jgi:hypothetical protein
MREMTCQRIFWGSFEVNRSFWTGWNQRAPSIEPQESDASPCWPIFHLLLRVFPRGISTKLRGKTPAGTNPPPYEGEPVPVEDPEVFKVRGIEGSKILSKAEGSKTLSKVEGSKILSKVEGSKGLGRGWLDFILIRGSKRGEYGYVRHGEE